MSAKCPARCVVSRQRLCRAGSGAGREVRRRRCPARGSHARSARSPHAFRTAAEAEPPALWERRIAASLDGREIRLVATDADRRFVGLAAVVPFGNRIRVILVLGRADPTRTRSGCAQLVGAVADWATECGLEWQIEVTPGSDPAMALYERLRFVAIDEAPPEGRDVVMVRRAI